MRSFLLLLASGLPQAALCLVYLCTVLNCQLGMVRTPRWVLNCTQELFGRAAADPGPSRAALITSAQTILSRCPGILPGTTTFITADVAKASHKRCTHNGAVSIASQRNAARSAGAFYTSRRLCCHLPNPPVKVSPLFAIRALICLAVGWVHQHVPPQAPACGMSGMKQLIRGPRSACHFPGTAGRETCTGDTLLLLVSTVSSGAALQLDLQHVKLVKYSSLNERKNVSWPEKKNANTKSISLCSSLCSS